MDRFIFTIIIAIAISPTFILTKPLFWLKTTTTTTTTAATTTTSSSSSVAATNSTTNITRFNNGNSVSVPLSITQTGSTVDNSAVSTLDQYIGDLNISVPMGRSARRKRTIFPSDTSNYTSDIQNCINQYPFDYQSAINNAVSSVISCISSSSRSLSEHDQFRIRNIIQQITHYMINDPERNLDNVIYRKTIFNGGQANIVKCAMEASDKIAQQALEAAQNVNDCIAMGTSTTSASTSTTTLTTSSTTISP